MANRNKDEGKRYELVVVHRYNKFGFVTKEGDFIPLFPKVATTRQLNKPMDNDGIDITTVDPTQKNDLGLTMQLKSRSSSPSYPKVLAKTKMAAEKWDSGIPIIYHKQTEGVENKETNTKTFMQRGEYVILFAEDFEAIYTQLVLYKSIFHKFMEYFEELPIEVQDKLTEFLKVRNMI